MITDSDFTGGKDPTPTNHRRNSHLHHGGHRVHPDEDGEEDEPDADQREKGDFRQPRDVPVQTERDGDAEGR